ncbi:MAG: hypothetical protein AABZ60_12770 [Planctomycetota bacterium]
MGYLGFLEFSDLEEQLAWQIHWLTGGSLFLIASVVFYWLFRQKQSTSPALKFYDTYLGYYLMSYSEIHPEILQQSEKTRERLRQLSIFGKHPPTQMFFAYLCWMEGRIYRYHQPHLRLLDLIEKEKIVLPPLQEAQIRLQIEQARIFFEKSLLFLQAISALPEQGDFLIENPPHDRSQAPLTSEQLQRFPLNWQEKTQELFHEMQELQAILTDQTLIGEWSIMVEKASEHLHQKGLQCFYCSFKDFHSLSEAAHCHPFELQSFLKDSAQYLLEQQNNYSIKKDPETLIGSS